MLLTKRGTSAIVNYLNHHSIVFNYEWQLVWHHIKLDVFALVKWHLPTRQTLDETQTHNNNNDLSDIIHISQTAVWYWRMTGAKFLFLFWCSTSSCFICLVLKLPIDINSQWRESWRLAAVVNAHLVDDPTIRQPGFALPRQQWSLLNRFRTGLGHCGACRKKWKLIDSDQCSCGETQTMSHIVESCPLTRLHGGLSKLHSADDDAVAWLTSYGS